MAADWRKATVRELVDEGVLYRPLDGNHGEIHPKGTDFVSAGIPFIMASDLVNGRVDTQHCAFISEEQARSLRKGFAVAGDVLISHKATMGRTAIVGELTTPFLVLTPQVTYYRVRDHSRLSNRFLKFYFDSPEFQKVFSTWGQKGSTRAYLGITSQLDLPILVPPIEDQRAIAETLGTLDDKIELNRRMSETLEAMARALFKSWFVDFEPVRAKAEGRVLGLPKQLADLFPDRLVDSKVGEVPAGWPLEPMGVHFEAVKGVSYKGSGLSDHGMPLHNLNSIYEGGGYKYEGIKHYTGEYAEHHVVDPGDLIVANTEQGHDRLLIGHAAIVPATLGERSIASHHLFRVRPRASSPLTSQYLCWLLNSPQMHDEVSGYANGTTVNMLPSAGLKMPLIVCPPGRLVGGFDSIAGNAGKRVEEARTESGVLAALRDTLLPVLVSGRLRVGKLECSVEERSR